MTSTIKAELLAAAAQWLRYQRKCFIICTERGIYPWGRPDVLGVTLQRQTVEVEIKVSMADFRANSAKRGIAARERYHLYQPQQFYFAVPPEMSDAVKAELPPYAGLLTLKDEFDYQPNRLITVVKGAPSYPEAKLQVHQIAHLCRHMSGTLSRQLGALYKARMTVSSALTP